MNLRSQHFLKKFQTTQTSEFFLFTSFLICKANVNSKLTLGIYINTFKRFSLPSAFQLEKDQKVQGPTIGMFHTSKINLIKFQFIKEFRAISFKWKQRWYIYSLVKDLTSYEQPSFLCLDFNIKVSVNIFKVCIIMQSNEYSGDALVIN